jgi:hypothetical protein
MRIEGSIVFQLRAINSVSALVGEIDMTLDEVWGRLSKDDAITRTIKVKTEEEGTHYLVETIDTNLNGEALHPGISPIIPQFSWRHFPTRPEAEADANARYEASLSEGFTPLP